MGIARAAGSVIEAVRRRGFQAQSKSDKSLVTEADIAADQVIARALTEMFPDDGWLSEESPVRWGDSGASWIVDPLDGTDAFVKGGPRGYAVQIARLVEGTIELGVVYEPAVDELFVARRGAGAWVSRRGGPVEPVRVTHGLAARRFVCSTRTRPEVHELMRVRGLVDAGAYRSVGVKVGLLASGVAEVYPLTHRVGYWDVCAPLLVLEEAGGHGTYFDGQRPAFPLDPPWEMEGPMLMSGLPLDEHLELCQAFATLVADRD